MSQAENSSISPAQYNQTLSRKRADTVKRYLEDNIAARVIDWDMATYGEARPTSTNETAEGRKDNRRVEVTFSFEQIAWLDLRDR